MFYVGVVKDIDDPVKIGRVRVSVLGLHDGYPGVETNQLPWASVTNPLSSGIGGKGFNTYMRVGAWVIVGFLDSDNQKPIVLGSVRGVADTNSKETSSYNKTHVFETDGGQYIEFDDSEGEITLKNGGSTLRIRPDTIQMSSNDIIINGKSSLNGDAVVTGNARVNGNLGVDGGVDVGNGMGVGGNIDLGGKVLPGGPSGLVESLIASSFVPMPAGLNAEQQALWPELTNGQKLRVVIGS